MNKFNFACSTFVAAMLLSACSSAPTKVAQTVENNDKAAWQQFKAQKAQDELAAEVSKQKNETDKSK
jgi:outer membrane biogenesis lipoprotein LolB